MYAMNLDFKRVGIVTISSRINATIVILEVQSEIDAIQCYGGPSVALWSGNVG